MSMKQNPMLCIFSFLGIIAICSVVDYMIYETIMTQGQFGFHGFAGLVGLQGWIIRRQFLFCKRLGTRRSTTINTTNKP